MSLTLRIIFIISAIGLVIFLLRSIARSKMRIEGSLFWMFLSLAILILSIFPGIACYFSDLFGFMAPVNFIFAFFIFILIVKCFLQSKHISQLETQVQELVQQVAISQLDHHERSRTRTNKHNDTEERQ